MYCTVHYLIEGQQHEVADGAVDEHEHVLEDDDHVLLGRHHAHVHHLRVEV